MVPASFICEVCGKTVKQRNFNRHMKDVHSKTADGNLILDQDLTKTKLTCVFCNGQYVRKDDLQHHINKIHLSLSDDSILNKCPKCPFSTEYKSSLRRHIKAHNKGKEGFEINKCAYCEKRFTKCVNFTKHMKDAHGENVNGDSIPQSDLKKEKFPCNLCNKQYVSKHELKRHINIIHLTSADSSIIHQCPMCTYSTGYKNCLKRHMNVHTSRPRKEKFFKCSYCSTSCINKRSLIVHVKKYHKPDQGKPGLRRKCCLCSKILDGYSMQVMRSHYEKVHNIPMEWENHSFNSIADFEDWKKTVEKETTSAYILYYSYKSSRVYKCHRSGQYRSRGQNIRKLKMGGSCKINTICPSAMKVDIKENKVLVSYLPSHVGHKNELKHIRLTAEDRNLIAEQLAEQIPHETILKSIRGSVTNSELQRIHLINKKDMFNIEQSFILNNEAIKDPFEVVVGLEAWVKELKTSRDKPFIAYKPQGEVLDNFPHVANEDFVLILMTEAQKAMLQKWGQDTVCIDRMHDVNSQNLQLYTLLTLDEIGEGFPAAFMLTNKGDESSLITFLESIKSVMGPILCNVFMSDMEETFYSSWETVMGPANSNICNTWHILKAWSMNLKSKILVQDKRESTRKLLLNVLYELDSTAFLKVLDEFLARHAKDTDTKSFCEYFEKQYVVNEQYMRWAYCYRINAGINTHMSLDNFNAALRNCNLRGKRIKQLDKNLCSVLTFLKDKLFDLIIKMKTDKLVQKMELLRKMHVASLSLNPNTISQPENDRWHVPSSQNSECHIVKRVKDCNNCFLRCDHCNSCLHEFVCSCLDNAINNHMCEHIHLVKRTLSDREDKSNVAVGNSVVVNMEEDKTDLPNSILYTISASKTERQQNVILHEEISTSRSENQHSSILYEEVSASRTENHYNLMSHEVCAPKIENQQNLIMYEEISASETENQPNLILNEIPSSTTVVSKLDIDTKKNLLVEKFSEYVMTNLTTHNEIEHFENILNQAKIAALML